jgi:hypothetical protein
MLVSIVCLLFPAKLSAQSLWLDGAEDNSLYMEILMPHKSDSLDLGFTAPSGTIFLTGRYSVKENIILVGEISIVHGEMEDDSWSNDAATAFGNPYLGAEFHLTESPLFFEVGFRIPIMPEDKDVAGFVGAASDIFRMEAFQPDIFPVLAAINYKTRSVSNILLRAHLGSVFFFNSGNILGNSDTDVIFNYSLQTGYAGQKLYALVGFAGRYVGTSPGYVHAERNFHLFGATITVPVGKTLLGIHFKIPLDDSAGDIFDNVVGFNFGINFN